MRVVRSYVAHLQVLGWLGIVGWGRVGLYGLLVGGLGWLVNPPLQVLGWLGIFGWGGVVRSCALAYLQVLGWLGIVGWGGVGLYGLLVGGEVGW